MTTESQYLTWEAAKILNLTPARIGQLVSEGRLQNSAPPGYKTPRFAPEEVERLRAERHAHFTRKADAFNRRSRCNAS